MLYKVLADIVVLIHFLWIVFLIFGGFLGRKNKVVRYFHTFGLAFAVIIQIFGWYCPLTLLEVWLRSKHDPSVAYKGSFIIHYLEKLIYIEISPLILFLITLFLIGVNFFVYKKC